MYFPHRGCVRPFRHLYGYATPVNVIKKKSQISVLVFYPCTQLADPSLQILGRTPFPGYLFERGF